MGPSRGQWYLDESQRRGRYTVAALGVDPGSVDPVRRLLRSVAPGGGSTRRHFTNERPDVRKRLIQVFRDLPGTSVVAVECLDPVPVTEQRRRCLTLIASKVAAEGLASLCLDHVEPVQQRRDRQVLARLLDSSLVTYQHEAPHSREPMLWVPDAVAWCVGRSEWRHVLDGWTTIHRA